MNNPRPREGGGAGPVLQSGLPGWLTDVLVTACASALTVLIMFLLWGVVEDQLGSDDAATRLIHFSRGVSTACVTALVVGWLVYRRSRRRALALEDAVARRTHELQKALVTLQVIVDNTPAGLLVVDRELNVVNANRVAERVHGRAIRGKCYDALACQRAGCSECPAQTTFETGRASSAVALHTDPRTGEVLAQESHLLRMPDGEDYVLLVERVVTEQKKLQARLLHQEKMAAFGLLAAGIAHDMGNPLSAVEMHLQLLDDAHMTNECRSSIATVRQEVGRLRRILRELVDFARRRRDEAALVSVDSVVRDALRLLRHDQRMRAVRSEFVTDPETPAVYMVEDHLMQVVLNLMINALDAMPEGGTLRVDLRVVGERVALRIHDSGVGMDRQVLSRCMEPLYTTKEPGKGTGLGLSITRDILTAAGGDIELHSAPRRGTTAVIILPAATQRAALPGGPQLQEAG